MKKKEPKQLKGLIIPLLVAFFNVLIILFPQDILAASRDGLSLWFNNVLPSLTPFIIGTNILTGLGFVNFLGTLLEPLMYPLFGVPGCGGYALVTGMMSGYPVGAKTVASLSQTGQLEKHEAQRLIAFCNNSGPLFMLGAVGNGMFSSTSVGYFLMISHYISAILTGFIFKFYKYNNKRKSLNTRNLFMQAVKNMSVARHKTNKGFGEILAISVKNAMETVTAIGGFIILFCVLVKIIEVTELMYWVLFAVRPIIQFFNIDAELFKGFFSGLIEVTNGCRQISLLSFSKTQLLLTVFIISFGGFSIFAQSVSFIAGTEINVFIYFISKIIQAAISAGVAFIIFPLFKFSSETVTAYFPQESGVLSRYATSSILFLGCLLFLLVLTIVISLFKRSGVKRR